MGKGLGEPTIPLPLPLTRSGPSLLDTKREGVVGLVLPSPTPHFLHLLRFLLHIPLFLLTHIEGRLRRRTLLGMGGDGVHHCLHILRMQLDRKSSTEAGSDPRGHLWVTWGVYLCAGKPPLADIILSHPPGLTRCDSVIGLAIPAMRGHIQYRGAAS